MGTIARHEQPKFLLFDQCFTTSSIVFLAVVRLRPSKDQQSQATSVSCLTRPRSPLQTLPIGPELFICASIETLALNG